MIAYADVPVEKYWLVRFNRNVIAPIETAQEFLAGVLAYQEGGRR
jgi:hypothetical protein